MIMERIPASNGRAKQPEVNCLVEIAKPEALSTKRIPAWNHPVKQNELICIY